MQIGNFSDHLTSGISVRHPLPYTSSWRSPGCSNEQTFPCDAAACTAAVTGTASQPACSRGLGAAPGGNIDTRRTALLPRARHPAWGDYHWCCGTRMREEAEATGEDPLPKSLKPAVAAAKTISC
jgi:hypothetical protein